MHSPKLRTDPFKCEENQFYVLYYSVVVILFCSALLFYRNNSRCQCNNQVCHVQTTATHRHTKCVLLCLVAIVTIVAMPQTFVPRAHSMWGFSKKEKHIAMSAFDKHWPRIWLWRWESRACQQSKRTQTNMIKYNLYVKWWPSYLPTIVSVSRLFGLITNRYFATMVAIATDTWTQLENTHSTHTHTVGHKSLHRTHFYCRLVQTNNYCKCFMYDSLVWLSNVASRARQKWLNEFEYYTLLHVCYTRRTANMCSDLYMKNIRATDGIITYNVHCTDGGNVHKVCNRDRMKNCIYFRLAFFVDLCTDANLCTCVRDVIALVFISAVSWPFSYSFFCCSRFLFSLNQNVHSLEFHGVSPLYLNRKTRSIRRRSKSA